ncbi:cytochrome d ubiquinol oxidase subunit II [Brevibacillus ginsengisoli]|uniref:cytochrome d ubiquinol oxidase subunit II n=1 Tax=Brevibacillus ginsengisoli TaxID=363854 RepID=UPI003CED21D9
MTHDVLAVIWFGLWGLIWALYFVLDGYSLGVGMLFPFLASNEKEQRQLQETIGPFWGANEVWLITAGGATFAAFPKTYALLFSSLYTPLFLILFALFFRAIGLEFMHKHHAEWWKKTWKWAFFTGSLLIALLFGVAFGNLYKGLLIDQTGSHVTLLNLLNPYAVLGGITFVSLFALSGAIWVSLKTAGDIQRKAVKWIDYIWFVASLVTVLFLVATANQTKLYDKFGQYPLLWIVPLLCIAAILITRRFVAKAHYIWAFFTVSLSILTLAATGFIGMFPYMILSKVDTAYSLSLFDAAGSELNLKIMFFVAVIIVPIVIAYQIWVQRIFKEKITAEKAKGYH